jgi:hypothetical protein
MYMFRNLIDIMFADLDFYLSSALQHT